MERCRQSIHLDHNRRIDRQDLHSGRRRCNGQPVEQIDLQLEPPSLHEQGDFPKADVTRRRPLVSRQTIEYFLLTRLEPLIAEQPSDSGKPVPRAEGLRFQNQKRSLPQLALRASKQSAMCPLPRSPKRELRECGWQHIQDPRFPR